MNTRVAGFVMRRVFPAPLFSVLLAVYIGRYKMEGGHVYDDVIGLQVPECFEASYCRDCSEMHFGSCNQVTSSCISARFIIYTSCHSLHITSIN